jgi:hypothetical protein
MDALSTLDSISHFDLEEHCNILNHVMARYITEL